MPEETITAAPAASGAGEGASVTATVESPTTSVETPSSSPTEITETQTTETPTGEETQLGPEATAEEKEDARYLPKTIRALKETDPEGFKREKTRFYEHRSYQATFPTVADAKRAKQTLDIVGGEEGVHQLQTDIGEFKTVASQFVNGDPAFVNDLAEMDPIAFGSHVAPMLEKYKAIDQEGFNREMASRISGEHSAWGLRTRLESAYQAIKAGKNDDALKMLNEIAGWHDAIDRIAKADEDPRYKKLKDQLKQALEANSKRDGDANHQAFVGATQKTIFSNIEKMVESYTKGKSLDDDDLTLLRQSVLRFADAEVKSKDYEKFIQDRNNILARGDTQSASRFVIARWDQAIEAAVKRVMRTFSKGAAGVAPKPSENGNGNGTPPKPQVAGFVRVSTRPNGAQIDTAKSPRWLIEKRATLKDGRKVDWSHLT